MSETNMATAIIPRSDQMNADDLLAGLITITITGVTIRGGQEQPVSIHFEGDNGKPWKPCKSMSRVLVWAWGADANNYKGRSVTLYCDPTVKWGGMAVGGIRISHLSHIAEPITMALTATKGSRKPFTVQPLIIEEKPDWRAEIEKAGTLAELASTWKRIPKDRQSTFVADKDARKEVLSHVNAS